MVATKHSPNRKERVRGERRKGAWVITKERVINGVAVGMTKEEAAGASGMSPRGIETLERCDPDFKAKMVEAEKEGEACRARAAGLLDRQLEAIAEAHVVLALRAEDEGIKAKVQAGILKGRGVLVEKPVVELNQDNRTLNIIVRSEETAELVKDLKAGVRRSGTHNDNSD